MPLSPSARSFLFAVLLVGCGGVFVADPASESEAEDEATPEPEPLLPLGDAIVPLGSMRSPTRPAHILDIEIDGDALFLATAGGLVAVDVSDPETPRPIGDFGGACDRLAVDDEQLVFGGRVRGVRSAARTNDGFRPSARVREDGWTPGGLALTDRHLLVAASTDGLEIRDRDDLSLRGRLLDASNAVDVATVGELAVVVDRDRGLLTVDLSEPSAPITLGELTLSSSPQALAARDGIVYVAASGSIVVVDVSDPAAPSVLADLRSEGVASRVQVSGDLLAVSNWFDTRIYDVADPLAPRLVGIEEATDSSMSVALDGDLLAVGDWNDLRLYRVDPTVGGPDISLPADVSARGDSAEAVATAWIANVGDRSLVIDAVTCDDARVTAEPSALTVELDRSEGVTFTVTDAGDRPWEARCTLASDDPDEPAATLVVAVNPTGLSVGDEAPDWTLPDLDGGLHTLSALRGEVVLITLFSGL